jgi:hypothetical protein
MTDRHSSCAVYWPPVIGTTTAGQGHCHHPYRRLAPAHLQRAPAVHLQRRHRPRPGPGTTTSTSTAGSGTKCVPPGKAQQPPGVCQARTGIGSPAAWLGRMALAAATSPAVPRGRPGRPAAWQAELMTIKEYRCGRSCLLFRVAIGLRVNGTGHALDFDARTSLLDLLREHLGLTGAKRAATGTSAGRARSCWTAHA